jgi:hypothetical protein
MGSFLDGLGECLVSYRQFLSELNWSIHPKILQLPRKLSTKVHGNKERKSPLKMKKKIRGKSEGFPRTTLEIRGIYSVSISWHLRRLPRNLESNETNQ